LLSHALHDLFLRRIAGAGRYVVDRLADRAGATVNSWYYLALFQDGWAGAYLGMCCGASHHNMPCRFNLLPTRPCRSLTVCALWLLRSQDINEPGPFSDRVVGCDGGFSHAPEAALFPAPISGFDAAPLGDITQNLQHFVACECDNHPLLPAKPHRVPVADTLMVIMHRCTRSGMHPAAAERFNRHPRVELGQPDKGQSHRTRWLLPVTHTSVNTVERRARRPRTGLHPDFTTVN
jgi:hypothetical protein